MLVIIVNKIKKYNYLILLLLSSCAAPLVIAGAGATTGYFAARDKGIKGAVSDSSISTKIKLKLYEISQNLHAQVSVNVQNGDVLLAGIVSNPQWKSQAEEAARQVSGVKTIINDITEQGEESIGSISQDAWITSKIKTSLFAESNVQSMNYSIKTINAIVFVMGTAQNKDELDKVLRIISNTRGVRKVFDHVVLKQDLEARKKTEQNAN